MVKLRQGGLFVEGPAPVAFHHPQVRVGGLDDRQALVDVAPIEAVHGQDDGKEQAHADHGGDKPAHGSFRSLTARSISSPELRRLDFRPDLRSRLQIRGVNDHQFPLLQAFQDRGPVCRRCSPRVTLLEAHQALIRHQDALGAVPLHHGDKGTAGAVWRPVSISTSASSPMTRGSGSWANFTSTSNSRVTVSASWLRRATSP